MCMKPHVHFCVWLLFTQQCEINPYTQNYRSLVCIAFAVSMVLNWGTFAPWEIWQYLETFFIVVAVGMESVLGI